MCGNKAKLIRGWCRAVWRESIGVEAVRFYRRAKRFYTQHGRVPEMKEIVG